MISISLPAPASVTKYALRAGASSISPSDWTIRFLDVNGIEVGRNTRASETFANEQIREFDIAATTVREVILTIKKTLAIVRPSLATFVNSAGLVEISPVNTVRFDHHPITLAPRGLLMEEARKNLVFDVFPLQESDTVETGSTLSSSGAMDAFKVLVTTHIAYHSLAYIKYVAAGT